MATRECVYDELLCFLGEPMFQIPVRTFMDENSLIFDPSIGTGEEHRAVHARYKKLIDTLLESFCDDCNLSMDDAVKGIMRMSEVPDLREVFNVLFEQVLSATDFSYFCNVMTKRNIMIQEQVLLMIIAATGSLPDSLAPKGKDGHKGAPAAKGCKAAPAANAPVDDKNEEEMLRNIMAKSKAEADREAAKKRKEDDELNKTLEVSKREAEKLQEDRHQLEQDLSKLALKTDKPPAAGKSAPAKPVATATQATVHAPPPPTKGGPVSTQAGKDVSSSDAANAWLKSAQAEAGHSATHTALAASLSKLSPEEIKHRQDFLKEQRDKLLAMKKTEREKQLGAATKSQPQRPQSARAARSAMGGGVGGRAGPSEEDEKKLAMRRAIADKLRQEVIGKH